MEKITVNGKEFEGYDIPLYGCSLLVIKGGKGFLGCGYLNLETAEKLGHALAVVTGVKDFGDMEEAKVVKVSSKAAELGIQPGMTGREALDVLY